YFLNFPMFGQDFDPPAPDGSWTFNIHAEPLPQECEIQCPPDVTIQCDESTDPSHTGTATCTGDGCTASYNDEVTPGDCPQEYTITRTWTCTDASGHSVSCVQTIKVVDTTPPVFDNCTPVNTDLGCNPQSIPECNPSVTASDDCGPATVTCTVSDTVDGCNHTRTITYTATDACGNTATCVQVYTWKEDTTPPVLNNLPTGGDLGCNPTPPSCDENVTATDDCDGEVDVTCTPSPVIVEGCRRSQTFTYSATDSCGNQVSQSVTYTWTEDNTPPDITCPNNITVSPTSTNPCSAVVEFEVNATDNCGTPTLSCVATFPNGDTAPVESGDTFPVGTTVVVCTATDACGNQTSCTFSITVQPCEELELCTFTQGGWGSDPRGNNPGQLLQDNFTAISGGDNSITIGLSGHSLTFTSASAIAQFLPQRGTPAVLPAGDAVNPSGTYGVLAGQVLALALNVGASDAGILPSGLGNLVLCNTGTALDGYSVYQLLALGNTALGGGSLPSGVTLSHLNDIITAINEGFDECEPTDWAEQHLCETL
ncbi:MAG TPA: HYR domain-containing protein, partial [Chthonomonadales bacterium]|nr:HYR domain-containing protein [Chthonomonadales bacterium]